MNKRATRDRRPTPALGLGSEPGALSQSMPVQNTTHFALERKGYAIHETIGSGGYSKVKVALHVPSNLKVCEVGGEGEGRV